MNKTLTALVLSPLLLFSSCKILYNIDGQIEKYYFNRIESFLISPNHVIIKTKNHEYLYDTTIPTRIDKNYESGNNTL